MFDVDDTLYLERDYVRSGFEAVDRWLERERGVRGFGSVAWRRFEEGTRGSTFDDALREIGFAADPGIVGELVQRYRAHVPSIELAPDARRCLDGLTGRFRLAGLTDGPVDSQRAKVEALRLARWLDPIVLTGELGAGWGKPDVRCFQSIERPTSVGGTGCVYVADNPAKDFIGPTALRWRTVRVRRPLSLHAGIDTPAGVDLEVADLDALLPSLRRWAA